jgi:hypothetical protein
MKVVSLFAPFLIKLGLWDGLGRDYLVLTKHRVIQYAISDLSPLNGRK